MTDEEPKTDFIKRRDEFTERYKALIDELMIDIVALPTFVPNDRGTWELTIQMNMLDRTEMPVKSPFVM